MAPIASGRLLRLAALRTQPRLKIRLGGDAEQGTFMRRAAIGKTGSA